MNWIKWVVFIMGAVIFGCIVRSDRKLLSPNEVTCITICQKEYGRKATSKGVLEVTKGGGLIDYICDCRWKDKRELIKIPGRP